MVNPIFSRLVSPRGVALASVAALLCGCGSGIAGLGGGTGGGNATAPAATASGPQLGYFWNAADQTLRPVLGIPGSSQVGASVVPAGAYIAGAGSSASEIGLLQEPDGSLDVMTLPTGSPQHLSATTTAGAKIRFSPGGKSALVFTPGATAVALVTGLKTAPVASAVTAAGAILDATVSDAGRVAVAVSGAAGATVQVLGTNGAASTVGSAGVLGGLSFVGTDDVVFADAAANTLTVVHNASTAPSPAQVPTLSLLQAPKALGVSPNGQWVLVANGGEASVVRLDLTAQSAPLRMTCSCTPTTVVALSGQGAFRVTEPASVPNSTPLWAVEAGIAAPRTFFIPAMPVAHP